MLTLDNIRRIKKNVIVYDATISKADVLALIDIAESYYAGIKIHYDEVDQGDAYAEV